MCYTIKGYIGWTSKMHLDTKKLCYAHDEVAHILYKALPLSLWIKQLPPYTIACKTQIILIFLNIFKTDSLSCYITETMKILELLNKQPSCLIKIFLKPHNHLHKILHLYWKNQNDIFPMKKMCYLKSYILQLRTMAHSKLSPLSLIPFNLLSLINTLLLQEKSRKWIEFKCLNPVHPFQGYDLLLTTKSLGNPGTLLIDLTMKLPIGVEPANPGLVIGKHLIIFLLLHSNEVVERI